ncbi:unnamed protein product, partial [Amoebophrya sp. A25]
VDPPPDDPGTVKMPRYPIPGTNVHSEDVSGLDYKFYFDTIALLFVIAAGFALLNAYAFAAYSDADEQKLCRKAVVVSMWRVMVTQWHNDGTRIAHENYE